MPKGLTYTDRFGHTWQVKTRRNSDGTWFPVFSNGSASLVGEMALEGPLGGLAEAQLKELFCDAEREVKVRSEVWYVGYRQRAVGTRGHMQGNLCTRFRAASGEVRYSREMLQFRTMAADALAGLIAAARGEKRAAASA